MIVLGVCYCFRVSCKMGTECDRDLLSYKRYCAELQAKHEQRLLDD